MFSLLLLRVSFLNDHFDRISRGRQILVYGDIPFADFRDPGYFLTLYVSAVAQWLTGGGLLGDALVASAAIATAGTLAFLLTASASGSLVFGLFAPLLMLLEPPRYYDYDKVLFYVAGLAACWGYIDSPTRARLAIAGIVTVLAALFRYDNGLYVFAACLASIATSRGMKSRAGLISDLAFYLGVVFVTALPALIFVQLTAGLGEAARQVATYAATEGRRSEWFELPALGFDRISITYLLIVAAVPIALLHVAISSRHPDSGSAVRLSNAKIIAAALLLTCVGVFVLRDPIGARLGAAVPIAVILAGCLWGRWQVPLATASWDRVSPALRRGALLVAVGVVVLVPVLRQQAWRVVRAPFTVTNRLLDLTSELRESPPRVQHLPNEGALAGLAEYLRACTPPDSRVLLTWFAPEVYFFAERGFAGGMTVFFGSHWSSAQDQRRTIDQLEAQTVPLVIMQTESERMFHSAFPLVAARIDANYRVAATTSFGDRRTASDGYQVLMARGTDSVGISPRWHLPCPDGGRRSESTR